MQKIKKISTFSIKMFAILAFALTLAFIAITQPFKSYRYRIEYNNCKYYTNYIKSKTDTSIQFEIRNHETITIIGEYKLKEIKTQE